MSSVTTAANRRLRDIQRHISPSSSSGGAAEPRSTVVLVLPSGEVVTVSPATPSDQDGLVELHVSGRPICRCITLPSSSTPKLSLEISAVKTPFEGATTHIPKTNVVEVYPPSSIKEDIPIADVWVLAYVLFTLNKESEHIPLRLRSSESAKIQNGEDIAWYLLSSGLGRLYQGAKNGEGDRYKGIIFLSRAAFWQGAGTGSFHNRGWLRTPRLAGTSYFPSIPSFTRTDLVIAAHPLRPPKPKQGEVLYTRYSAAHGEMLEFTAFDLGTKDTVSPHLAAFHKWHNDDRVNVAWGEQGSLEKHREYIETLMNDPGVLPMIMSWDGELMGYVELVWIKENHVAQHFPEDVKVGEWDRGIHVLVGEERFLGNGRSEVWLRALAHYSFLEDPRTLRVVGEPKASNIAINKAGIAAGYLLATTIDFPYKRSSLLINTRERFFNMCRLH